MLFYVSSSTLLTNSGNMVLRFYPPTLALSDLVQAYLISHVQTDRHTPLLASPFPPEAEQTLFFYPRDPMYCFHHRSNQTQRQPSCLIVGPQLSRVDITMGHDHLVIAVFFKPGGLHRLLGMPMNELADDSLDASLLWSSDIRRVDEQLRQLNDYDQMQQIVETFLLEQFRRRKIGKHPVDTALKHLLILDKPVSLDYLADQACLSPRQFERQCYERLGMGPKMFSRVARFSKAFRLKEKRPDLDWLEVALRCGYYDFQHMLRDFKAFAGSTPTLLLAAESGAAFRPYTSTGL